MKTVVPVIGFGLLVGSLVARDLTIIPAVLKIVTERLLERIRRDPGAKLFSVSQNGWYNFCTCTCCRAIDEREESPAGTMITFVNQVANTMFNRMLARFRIGVPSPGHLLFFFSCLAIFFSFGVFVGFFLVSFFASLVFIG